MQRLVLAAVPIALVAACKPKPVAIAEDAAAAASASAAPSASAPPSAIAPHAGASREERETAIVALLSGKLASKDIADEPTDPGRDFDGSLRHRLLYPPRKPPVVRVASAEAQGLDPDAVTRVARITVAAMRACYTRGLSINPTLEGRIKVRAQVGADGAVIAAQDAGSDLPDAHVVDCVLARFRALAFPAPAKAPANVVVPYFFSPGT